MIEPGSELKLKLKNLKDWISKEKGVIVAFSGGIDSSLLLYVARLVLGKEKTIAVVSKSESLKARDFEIAQSFCRQYDILLEVIHTQEMEDSRYNENPVNRCYFCKDHLYNDLLTVVKKFPDFRVLNGTNLDDHSDYRPGLQAALEYQVLSPLAECKFNKQDIRDIARNYELPNWDKPASPCLSSRVPYTHKITRKKLVEIENAENFLNDSGFIDVRVRHYGEYGRIEVKPDDLPRLMAMKESLIPKIKEFGFKEIEIDEEGLVSGKLNRVIASKNVNP
ncbi:MAG: ATP-dependent sacrificial sulfur transferase LarE [Bacteroidales bacterium]|nr:ATP-dependent sacrificial sulfur transferase LarE [Bacteroidales bacterium]MCB9013817.1 ATP-dependent sacrificial sulfur transferase LarE [Bacteroidales bacterium]